MSPIRGTEWKLTEQRSAVQKSNGLQLFGEQDEVCTNEEVYPLKYLFYLKWEENLVFNNEL